jgi:acyl-CoA reductase-like NAD-dependent aldehyde dehydrogenase
VRVFNRAFGRPPILVIAGAFCGRSPTAYGRTQRRSPTSRRLTAESRSPKPAWIFSVDILEYYAGLASKIYGQTAPLPGKQIAMVLCEPCGVVGQITPWNFPLYVAAWKFAPALCCGNSIVLKPSELTSMTILATAKMAAEVGVPAGVFNVVCGLGKEAGAALASHAGVDVLAFTGGAATGRTIMRARADLLRPTQLELCGKSPDIIFEDADLKQAVAGAAFGIFYNQGENCNAGSRILVHENVHDQFMAGLMAAVQRIRVLPPLDEASQMGSLISAAHLEKVSGYVDIAASEGCESRPAENALGQSRSTADISMHRRSSPT